MAQYITGVLQPYADSICHLRPRPAVVNDNHASHVHESTLTAAESAGLRFTQLPPNLTSVLQPVDVGINKPFKNLMSDLYVTPQSFRSFLFLTSTSHSVDDCVSQLRYAQWSRELNKIKLTLSAQQIKDRGLNKPSIDTIIGWVLDSWARIDSSIVVRSFEATGLSLAADGSEDHLLSHRLQAILRGTPEEQAQAREELAMTMDDDNGEEQLSLLEVVARGTQGSGFLSEDGDAEEEDADMDEDE